MKGYNVGLEDEKIFVDSQHMFGLTVLFMFLSIYLSVCLRQKCARGSPTCV